MHENQLFVRPPNKSTSVVWPPDRAPETNYKSTCLSPFLNVLFMENYNSECMKRHFIDLYSRARSVSIFKRFACCKNSWPGLDMRVWCYDLVVGIRSRLASRRSAFGSVQLSVPLCGFDMLGKSRSELQKGPEFQRFLNADHQVWVQPAGKARSLHCSENPDSSPRRNIRVSR